jgi:hypothetical protein
MQVIGRLHAPHPFTRTHCLRGWVGPGAGLVAVDAGHTRGSNPGHPARGPLLYRASYLDSTPQQVRGVRSNAADFVLHWPCPRYFEEKVRRTQVGLGREGQNHDQPQGAYVTAMSSGNPHVQQSHYRYPYPHTNRFNIILQSACMPQSSTFPFQSFDKYFLRDFLSLPCVLRVLLTALSLTYSP